MSTHASAARSRYSCAPSRRSLSSREEPQKLVVLCVKEQVTRTGQTGFWMNQSACGRSAADTGKSGAVHVRHITGCKTLLCFVMGLAWSRHRIAMLLSFAGVTRMYTSGYCSFGLWSSITTQARALVDHSQVAVQQL